MYIKTAEKYNLSIIFAKTRKVVVVVVVVLLVVLVVVVVVVLVVSGYWNKGSS